MFNKLDETRLRENNVEREEEEDKENNRFI